jgi:hypothetical protein
MEAMKLVLKSILITALVIFCFQIKWEGKTLEERTLDKLETLGISEFVHETAQGGVAAGKDFYQAALIYWNSPSHQDQKALR